MQDFKKLLTNDIVLTSLSEELVNAYRRELADYDHNASGKLSETARYELEVNGEHFQVFFNLQDYYRFLEDGRKSGKFPPQQSIINWINFKGIIPHADSKGRIPTTKQLAFLISRKIANEGTQPQNVLAHALENANPIIDRMVDRIVELIQHDINRELVSVFGK